MRCVIISQERVGVLMTNVDVFWIFMLDYAKNWGIRRHSPVLAADSEGRQLRGEYKEGIFESDRLSL